MCSRSTSDVIHVIIVQSLPREEVVGRWIGSAEISAFWSGTLLTQQSPHPSQQPS